MQILLDTKQNTLTTRLQPWQSLVEQFLVIEVFILYSTELQMCKAATNSDLLITTPVIAIAIASVKHLSVLHNILTCHSSFTG